MPTTEHVYHSCELIEACGRCRTPFPKMLHIVIRDRAVDESLLLRREIVILYECRGCKSTIPVPIVRAHKNEPEAARQRTFEPMAMNEPKAWARFECAGCHRPMIIDGIALDRCPCGTSEGVAVVRYATKPTWFTGTREDFHEGRGPLGPKDL